MSAGDIKLSGGVWCFAATNVKATVCYHIHRNYCAYLSYRNTTLILLLYYTRFFDLKTYFLHILNFQYKDHIMVMVLTLLALSLWFFYYHIIHAIFNFFITGGTNSDHPQKNNLYLFLLG